MSATWNLTSAPDENVANRGFSRVGYQASPTEIAWTGVNSRAETATEPTQISIVGLKAWTDRERDLARIRDFKHNWDGLEAEPPNKLVTDRAELFLRILRKQLPASPPMRILLSADSSIAFEWAMGKYFVQAEITDSDEIEWMFAFPGKETQFRTEVLESASNSNSEQGQVWQPVPTVVEERAYASAL